MNNSNRYNLFCTDLVETLITEQRPVDQFKTYWNSIPPNRRPLLCYNTRRCKNEAENIIFENYLPRPEFLITGLGTHLYNFVGTLAEENMAFRKSLGAEDSWNRDVIDEIVNSIPKVECRPSKYQTPYKSSWHLKDASPELITYLETKFQEKELGISICSNGKDFDIIPEQASKGAALQWLCLNLNCPLKSVIIAGKTASDRSMFKLDEVRKILSYHARPQLRDVAKNTACFKATEPAADGIIEGLQYFGLQFSASKINVSP